MSVTIIQTSTTGRIQQSKRSTQNKASHHLWQPGTLGTALCECSVTDRAADEARTHMATESALVRVQDATHGFILDVRLSPSAKSALNPKS